MTAVVREWHDEDGWGVVDSPETPGGCWVHAAQVAVDGYRALTPGQEVELEHEAVTDQDGYRFRAVRAWPKGAEPVVREPGGPSSAYRSSLRIEFD
jgi:cold shock protein